MPKRFRNGKNKQRKSTIIPVPRLRTVLPLSIRFRVQRSQAYSVFTTELQDLYSDNAGGKIMLLLKANFPGQVMNPDGDAGRHEITPIEFGNPSATLLPGQVFPGSNIVPSFWGMSKIVGGVDAVTSEPGPFLAKYNKAVVTRSTVKYSVVALENNPKTNMVSYTGTGEGGSAGPPIQPGGFQSGRFYVAANTGKEISASQAEGLSDRDPKRHGWDTGSSVDTLQEGALPNWNFTVGDSIAGTRNAGIAGSLSYDQDDAVAAGNTVDLADQTYSPGHPGTTTLRVPETTVYHRVVIGPVDASRCLPDMKIRFVEEMEIMAYELSNSKDAWPPNIRGGQLTGITSFDRNTMSMML
jgi:hypothetical protein